MGPQHDLPVVLEKPEAQRLQHRPAGTDPQGTGPLGLGGSASRPVYRIADRSCRRSDHGQHRVGVGLTQQGSDGVVLLQPEAIATATSHHVQGVPGVQQRAVSRVNLSVRAVCQPRGGQRTQDRHVAQPAACLLQVWFDALSQVPVAAVSRLQGLDQLRQSATGIGAPVVAQG